MAYISRNYALNQSYFIDQNSFNDITKHVLEKIEFSNIKTIEVITQINKKKSSFVITIKMATKTRVNMTKTLKNLVKLIENKVFDLFQIQPENIVIILDGEF